MTKIVKVDSVHGFPIWVKDEDGVAVEDLTDDDFDKLVFQGSAIDNATVVTVTECAAGGGRYWVTLTPASAADYEVAIYHATYNPAPRGWHEEFKATALGIPTVQELVDAVLDLADTVDGEETLRGAIKLLVAFAAGEGAGTVDKPYLDLSGTKERLAATFASDGSRATVTRDTT
jgi:hypothetical protein